MRQIIVAAATLVLAACSRQAPPRPVVQSADRTAPGETVAATLDSWPDTYEAVGTVRARTSAAISTKVMGYVRAMNVRAGDRVREGQVLATLDSRDLEAALKQADAALSEARAGVLEADSGVASASASLELARTTAARIEDLYRKKSVSNQELDEAVARRKAAQAAHEMAIARRRQLDARIAQAEQARQAADVTRSYAEIRAPFAGLVTARTADPGVLATPGAPLVTIEREGAYRLEAQVEESRLAQIRVGQAATVTLDSPARTIAARVSEIVPAVDAASRSATVKIDLPALAELRSGAFGRAQFALASRQVLAIPATALIERGQLQSVMVVENGGARARLITIGRTSNGSIEVLSGLTAGERVEVHP
jgi:RND family efflux transporter MFP subunit